MKSVLTDVRKRGSYEKKKFRDTKATKIIFKETLEKLTFIKWPNKYINNKVEIFMQPVKWQSSNYQGNILYKWRLDVTVQRSRFQSNKCSLVLEKTSKRNSHLAILR